MASDYLNDLMDPGGPSPALVLVFEEDGEVLGFEGISIKRDHYVHETTVSLRKPLV